MGEIAGAADGAGAAVGATCEEKSGAGRTSTRGLGGSTAPVTQLTQSNGSSFLPVQTSSAQ